MKKRVLTITAAAAVVIILGTVVGVFVQRGKPAGGDLWETLELQAVKEGPAGVETDSALTLTAARRIKAEDVQKALKFEPSFEYALDGKGKSYNVTPLEPLRENTVYKAVVTDPETGRPARSFAFQTRTDLMIEHVYPSQGEEYVDPATGIEVSLNVADADVESAFSIEPHVEGRFEKNAYGAVFIPNAPLDLNTIYRVTLDAGLSVPDGRTLGESSSFSFTTRRAKGEHKPYDDLQLAGNVVELYLPGDEIALSMHSGSDMAQTEFDVAVQRYPAIEDYIKAIQERDNALYTRTGKAAPVITDTAGLETVSAIRSALHHEESRGVYKVVLPEGLEEGCYIVTLTGESPQGYPQLVQAFFQVANLSLYSQSVDGDTLVWLNSPLTGQPVGGVQCSAEKPDGTQVAAAQTDERGLASMQMPAEASGGTLVEPRRRGERETYLRLTREGQTVYFAPVGVSGKRAPPLSDAYQTALYTDREIYRPTDSVRFWGVVRPRLDAPVPDKVKVLLVSSWDQDELYSAEAPVLQDGTFTGELPFELMRQRGYTLMVTDGEGLEEGNTYKSKSLSIEDFTKPPFVITVSNSRSWYFADEPVDFTLSASYYDGTPVAGGKLRLSCSNIEGLLDQGSVITLDEYGKGTYSGKWKEDDGGWTSWQPQSVWYQVSAADAQDVYSGSGGSVRVVPSRSAARMDYDESGRSIELEMAAIRQERLDPKVERIYEEYPTEYDWYAALPATADVTLTIKKTERILVPESTYYDEVSKKNVTNYRRDFRESVVGTYEGKTSGGRCVFRDLPIAKSAEGEDVSYEAVVSFEGGTGIEVAETLYNFQDTDRGVWEETVYSFIPHGTNRWDRVQKVEADGELTLGLYRNGESIDNEGRVFYSLVQRGVLDTGVYGPEGQRVGFAAQYQPNLWVSGAYFDGRYIHEMETGEFRQDYTNKTLNVQVRAGQEKYRPGQTAKVEVTLSDAQGNPVAGSACVGVVDEAIFALAEQEIDIAGQLYASIFRPNITHRSYTQDVTAETAMLKAGTGTGGGGMEGGKAVPRAQFDDTALFIPVQVDESGRAEVDVPLPDNVTSWRVSAAAVASDLKAGDGKGVTIATLPFVLRPLVTDRYVDGDDVCVSVLGSGPSLGQPFDFSVRITPADGGAPKEETVLGSIGKQTPVNFGKLPAGDYELLVDGSWEGESDAVSQTITVTEEGAAVLRAADLSLEELSALEAVRYPVDITLYDQKREPYMKALAALSRQDSSRTEIIAAARGASLIWDGWTDSQKRAPAGWDGRLDGIQEGGGVKILPRSGPDAAATAKMLLAAPGLIEAGQAEDYLKAVLRDVSATPEQRVMAYAGLAARGEPVLLDLRRLASQPELGASDKLWVGSALALLGDLEAARVMYEGAAGAQGDEPFSGAAALLAVLTGSPDADARVLALTEAVEAKPEDRVTPANLELLACIQHSPLTEQGSARVRYRAGGQDIEEDIRPFKSLSMGREQLRQAGFKAVEGEVRALARYEGYRDASAAGPDGVNAAITLTKEITPLEGGEFSAPNMALVTLRAVFSGEAPRGMYVLTDRIPSGMRYLGVKTSDQWEDTRSLWFDAIQTEGQTVRAYIHLYDEEDAQPLARAEEYGMAEPVPDFAAASSAPPVAGALSVGYKRPNPGTEPGAVPGGSGAPEDQNGDKTWTVQYYVNCALPGEYKDQGAVVEYLDADGVFQVSQSGGIRIE